MESHFTLKPRKRGADVGVGVRGRIIHVQIPRTAIRRIVPIAADIGIHDAIPNPFINK